MKQSHWSCTTLSTHCKAWIYALWKTNSHEVVRRVSCTLIARLEEIVHGDWEQPDLLNTRIILSALLDAPFLSLLFQYRVIFNRIAANSTEGSNSSLIITWVDIVLARLGQAITVAAGTFFRVPPIDQHQPMSVRAQREDDILRAAVQLPDKWTDIVHVLSSKHVSPAAYRLVMCLVFGVYVIAPHLSEQLVTVDRVEYARLLEALQTHIAQISDRRSQGIDVNFADASERERVAFAMFVSLYAVLSRRIDDIDSSCRPQTHAVLLEIIQAILERDTALPLMSIVSLPACVDISLVVLMRWGATLPWAWVTWEDVRICQSEVVEHLTATWLYTLDTRVEGISHAHSLEYWDHDLIAALEQEPRAALSMMARLLRCGLCRMKDTSARPPDSIFNTFLKICWSILRLLQGMEADHASTVALFGVLCNLFVLLSDGEIEISIKDLIIETLCLSKTGLQGAIMAIAGSKPEFSLNVNRALEHMCKVMTDQSRGDNLTFTELHAVRQNLQFITLVWITSTTSSTIPESIERFLTACRKCFEDADSGSLARAVLGDALVGISTALEQRREEVSFEQLKNAGCHTVVWQLVRDAEPSDLTLASALAAYFGSMSPLPKQDPLSSAEAWDYFRDVLLLILDGDFEGSDEPLSLLVAPLICRALVVLFQQGDRSARRYFVTSPWTTCVAASLKNLRNTGNIHADGGEYAVILHERMGLLAEHLCNHVRSTVHLRRRRR
ncbi:hypothetical protein C8Q74DRAFT_183839 [Fomes fomentarius]|nr:hypothetical protein C8Q74DRAFT_183839 [Fomes fomentarius]